MVLMGLVLSSGILCAQEIYDPGNSLYIKEGTEVHVSAPTPGASSPEKKAGPEPGKHRNRAAAAPETRLSRSEKPGHKPSATEREVPKTAFAYTGKETSHFTSGRQDTHSGILAPGNYTSKAPAATLLSCRITKILSAEDFTQHKFIYKESHRPSGISYSNSCRPPPDA